MTMLDGYHFCEIRDGVPVLRDGTPLEIGREYVHEGELELCRSGYHDSERALDALAYAPGTFFCRVKVSGDIVGCDKRVSRRRVAVSGYDARRALVDFASRAAYCALLSKMGEGWRPDPRSWEAVRAARAWVDDPSAENSDAALSSAYDAADASYASYVSCAAYDASYAAYDASCAAADAAYAVYTAVHGAAHAARSVMRCAPYTAAAGAFLESLLLECLDRWENRG